MKVFDALSKREESSQCYYFIPTITNMMQRKDFFFSFVMFITGCLKNKARNSHKPRLGKYVQQGNNRSITYIVRGILFHFSFKKKMHKKYFEKKVSLKYIGSEGVENKSF